MKTGYFIAGLLIGGVLSFVLTRHFFQGPQTDAAGLGKVKPDTSVITKGEWPDSLDAVKAAPESHAVIYEDSTIRILQVVLQPNKTEPVHTHQWKSVMWFAQATPMTYYQYGSTNNHYTITDSVTIPQMPPEVLNHGEVVDAEGPHAVKNSGSKNGIAYRVEFKND